MSAVMRSFLRPTIVLGQYGLFNEKEAGHAKQSGVSSQPTLFRCDDATPATAQRREPKWSPLTSAPARAQRRGASWGAHPLRSQPPAPPLASISTDTLIPQERRHVGRADCSAPDTSCGRVGYRAVPAPSFFWNTASSWSARLVAHYDAARRCIIATASRTTTARTISKSGMGRILSDERIVPIAASDSSRDWSPWDPRCRP
jgi:hypothetical protein